MRRTRTVDRVERAGRGWPLLGLLLAVTAACTWAAVAGAGDEQPGPAPAERTAPDDARWRRLRPRATLLLVGREAGRLAPAAAAPRQSGGLDRLAVVLDLLRERADGALACLSVGGHMAPPARTPLGQAQLELKGRLVRSLFSELGVHASLLAAHDLFVRPLVDSFEGQPGREGADAPRLPANVLPARRLGLDPDAPTRPWVDFQLRSFAVRALSVVDEAHGEALRGAGLAEYVMAPATALQGLTPNPDVLWLVVVDGAPSTLEAVSQAVRLLGPAVVLDLSGTASEQTRERVRVDVDPLVVSFADRGRAVGVLDVELNPGGRGPLVSYCAQPLTPGFDAVPSRAQDGVLSLLEAYRSQVRRSNLLALLERRAERADEARYVGSAACAGCHPGISQSWSKTGHARALRSLRALGADTDPECLACHVLGAPGAGAGATQAWPASGFLNPEDTPHLGGVGCESCHGPGSKHVEEPGNRALFAAGGPNRRRPASAGCLACHDAENSAGFAPADDALWARIDHREVPTDRRTLR